MVSGNSRSALTLHATTMVVAMYAFSFSKIRLVNNKCPRITCAPMSRDVERQTYMNKTYNCNDVECVSICYI
jgi:hypothetical protein